MTAYFQFEQFHRTWAFSTTFSSENPPRGRSIRISPPYAHIWLMNSFSTCKNGRNPLFSVDYAHPVGFYDSISGFTPKSIILPNVSAIPETINNSPLRNRILHTLYIFKHWLCGFASVFCDDLHDRTSDDDAICGGSHLLCLLRR